MATAIEYGLIAAIIGVASIAALNGLQKHEEPLATEQQCTVLSLDKHGYIRLKCAGNPKGVMMSTQDTELAMEYMIHSSANPNPPPMLRCDLYRKRKASCSLA